MNYADKSIAYLHMAALIGNAASKIREYADDPIIVELAAEDSNAEAFREWADSLERESRAWTAIHVGIATMAKDRPFRTPTEEKMEP